MYGRMKLVKGKQMAIALTTLSQRMFLKRFIFMMVLYQMSCLLIMRFQIWSSSRKPQAKAKKWTKMTCLCIRTPHLVLQRVPCQSWPLLYVINFLEQPLKMLELIHFHCPKPNNCIYTELKEFQLFFQAMKHPILKHFYCPNIICKVYTGTSPPESGAYCTVCGTPLSCSSYFIKIPILEQLKTILSHEFIALI